MNMEMKTKLSATTVALHWIVALTMIGLLATGLYMYETSTYWLYNWHKSVGILMFAVILARVLWRIKQGWPTPASEYKQWEQSLSHAVHWILIIATLVMPLSGFMHSAAGGYGIYLFGIGSLEIIPHNPDPEDPTNLAKHVPYSSTLDVLGGQIHKWAGYIAIATVLLHIVGALKHHIVDKDGTLKRMLGGYVSDK